MLEPQRNKTRAEQEAEREALAALPTVEASIKSGEFIYCYESHPTQCAECWDWLSGFIRLVYTLIKQGSVRRLRILATYEKPHRD